jgi:acyl-CoA thioesterase
MLPSLDEVLTAQRLDESIDQFVVPSGFGQGKATFGGLVVGACVRSMASRVTDPARTLRSVSAQLIGAPMPGPSRIRVRVLRSSLKVTTLSAELEQNGEVMTHVVALFASERPVEATWQHLPVPQLVDWTSLAPLDTNAPFAPEFTKHFEFRSLGPLPYAGSLEPPRGFVRPATMCRVRDGGFIACLIDAWWLACLARFDEMRPAATITYNAELHASVEGLDPQAPFFHVGKAVVAKAGYSLETRELWGVDGRLIATNTQVVAIIK